LLSYLWDTRPCHPASSWLFMKHADAASRGDKYNSNVTNSTALDQNKSTAPLGSAAPSRCFAALQQLQSGTLRRAALQRLAHTTCRPFAMGLETWITVDHQGFNGSR
jgi:hypothetical protein